MYSDTAPQPAYEIAGKRWVKDTPGFSEAIVYAFERRLRPRCLCRQDRDGQGIEMYVARLMDGCIVKRMPKTGIQHATTCLSYVPPSDISGLGSLLGTAIVEDPTTGKTTLKIDFPVSKLPGRTAQHPSDSSRNSVAANGHRLGLGDLLHYLWDQAELTHWRPEFSGRRTWGTVRKHLMQAAENKFIHRQALLGSLYIPEVFSVEQRDAIQCRRQRFWAHGIPRHRQPQPMLLMVAEVKDLALARYGYKAVFKHLPDQAFALDDALYRRLCKSFEHELILWGTEPDLHLVMIVTFRLDEAGLPCIVELSLLLTTAQWLPVDDAWDRQLVGALVRQDRIFIKTLRYITPSTQALVRASLLDCGPTPCSLIIDRGEHLNCLSYTEGTELDSNDPVWRWNPTLGEMPALPSRLALVNRDQSRSKP